MSALNAFPWPRPSHFAGSPVWNGAGFTCEADSYRVLCFDSATSHWSDDLTALHEAEAGPDHPIDVASRKLAVASMKRLGSSSPVLLDVGCSSGYVLEELQKEIPGASLIGADYLQGPLEGLARRMSNIPILQFDLRNCPLSDGCVDGVTCLNVLEHIDDDAAAMKQIHRILKPGGIAHIEVPAGPELFDIYDEVLLHHRRYRLTDLVELAKRAGFVVERATHLGCLVYPAFWAVKKKNRRKLGLPESEKKRLVTQQIRTTGKSPILSAVIGLETWFGARLSFPFGIRCVGVLRKAA